MTPIEFLKKRPLISVTGLETHLSIPRGTLKQSVWAGRKLPEKYIDDLIKVLKDYGYKAKINPRTPTEI